MDFTFSVTEIVQTSCARGDMICPHPSPPLWAPPSRRNVAEVSHAQYVLRSPLHLPHVKAAVSKAA